VSDHGTDGRPLLSVEGLSTYLFTKSGILKAVDDVSFSVDRGQCLGLVGESGSGKSMTCLSIIQLLPEHVARIVGGSVVFNGEELVGKSQSEIRAYRGRRISMILQDPMTSLNPAFTIGNQVLESVRLRYSGSGREASERVVAALRSVKIPAPQQRVHDYPHQMSGGMRQRVVGAMAVAGEAELLIADEPTTALDVTIQAEYLALLRSLQRERNMAILFVTHDLGIVAHMCDRVAVMYAGKIVELADVVELFDCPAHPYTEALLNSVPTVECKVSRLRAIDGHPPDLRNLPRGCSFESRCQRAVDRCKKEEPPAFALGGNRWVRCWVAQSGSR
jgi:oligopeptide/dipeptide ABC transporter ATP-binding protein